MNSLESKWSSLGIAFEANSIEDQKPEEAIMLTISSDSLFPIGSRMLSLMLLWLSKYHTYVMVDIVKSLVKNIEDDLHRALLGGVARKMVNLGDHRWEQIVIEVKNHLHEFSFKDDELALKMRGIDYDFNEFGLFVRKIYNESERKLLRTEVILKNNRWLYNRRKFGANSFADLITRVELCTFR